MSPSFLPYSLPVLSANHQDIHPPSFAVREYASPSDVDLHRNELRTVTVLLWYKSGAADNRQHPGLCVLDAPVHPEDYESPMLGGGRD